jgi:hypothetical protein
MSKYGQDNCSNFLLQSSIKLRRTPIVPAMSLSLYIYGSSLASSVITGFLFPDPQAYPIVFNFGDTFPKRNMQTFIITKCFDQHFSELLVPIIFNSRGN